MSFKAIAKVERNGETHLSWSTFCQICALFTTVPTSRRFIIPTTAIGLFTFPGSTVWVTFGHDVTVVEEGTPAIFSLAAVSICRTQRLAVTTGVEF